MMSVRWYTVDILLVYGISDPAVREPWGEPMQTLAVVDEGGRRREVDVSVVEYTWRVGDVIHVRQFEGDAETGAHDVRINGGPWVPIQSFGFFEF